MQTEIELRVDEKPKKESNELVQMADSIIIEDDLSFSQAIDLEKTLKAFIEGPGTFLDERIDQAHKLHKDLCNMRNAIVDPVKAAWKSLKDRRALWQDEQNRKREEEQRRREAEARRLEEEKQAKIQAKIDEENRKIREAQEEEARKQREKDAELARIKNKESQEKARREEEARRQAEATRLEEERRRSAEKTAALQEKKESVYVPVKPLAPVAQAAGATLSYDYEPVVENKAIVPDQYKIVDLAMLKKMQKAAKGTLNIPGVRFNKKPIGALRAAS